MRAERKVTDKIVDELKLVRRPMNSERGPQGLRSFIGTKAVIVNSVPLEGRTDLPAGPVSDR
jgi:hypothetical protein